MKYLLLVLTAVALVGCNGTSENEEKLNDFVAAADPFAWEMVEEETTAYTLTYPLLTSGPGVIVESVNSGMKSGSESFVKQANDWAAEVAADPEIEGSAPWILAIDPAYSFQDETFMSLQLNNYDYSGGAHGNAYYGVLNYHPSSATFITLPDLFEGEDYLTAVSEFVKQEVALIKADREEGYDIEADEALQDGVVPDIKNFKTFVFVDGPEGRGLQFLFAPYQLGAYVEGSFEILVPVGILAEFVKPEYKAWFTGTPAEAADYKGLSVKQAEALADEKGVRFRIVEQDGQPLPATKDYRPGRINATVVEGTVESYQVEGEPAEESVETLSVEENIIPRVAEGDKPVLNPEVDTVIKTSRVLFPDGKEQLEVGRDYEIRWESEGIDLLTLELHEHGRLKHTIAEGILAAPKAYSWTPDEGLLRGQAYRQYQLVMVDTETGETHDSSDETFMLLESEE